MRKRLKPRPEKRPEGGLQLDTPRNICRRIQELCERCTSDCCRAVCSECRPEFQRPAKSGQEK